ncbi:MAG TPA: hypothetical protein VFX12_09735 [Vicinamibacterales bacterium]|nr:hypothetical protein [Vicinamibacterales bacterium]
MIRPLTLVLSIVCCAMLGPGASAHTPPTDVTYTRDIAPILQSRCAGCHRDGGFRPMPLENFQEARHWAKAMREDVLERRMPPWPAAAGFAEYENDRSLSPIEIELLTAWADGGTPLGTPVGASPLNRTPSTEPLRFEVPAGHPAKGYVERVIVQPHAARDRWIRRWEFTPAAPGLIQQAILSVADRRLGSWVAAESAVSFPSGSAFRLPAGAPVTIELHYTKSDVAEIPGGTLALFPGPAGDEVQNLTLGCSTTTLPYAMTALAITPVARGAGESVEIVARERNGRVTPLCVVLRYAPAYPATYRFRTPMALARGTRLDVRSSAPGCGASLEFSARTPGRAAAR